MLTGQLSTDKVGATLVRMFGADSKPHGKDLHRVAQRLQGKSGKHDDTFLAGEAPLGVVLVRAMVVNTHNTNKLLSTVF